ncbi:MAG: bifunctional precorrin-2 dehydrogenase/sirohydrochlorin ferrochelatase [Fusobacteriaceae bacterium]|jgi:glutamate-1-semialdehyde 2,1-aminomutase/precorrin-2 dehydrogenase/sirohydrochlorin ferrochelatase|nr:bifunctional precorrin-2 dehydrogenase/sirohydrochlorin ferrochelatase [Fusobacteriaceae bacterium]MBP6466577.1 bifunctional precorrin-2 dehydrogenase/sirohydrochlorin ferrochelatase [Fusobacteriaceae bacterium]MBP9595410.1 bifunctional precorrin-2 dehydrogenase/sirohydrochlorin ferrochelatase [Fusobacteriaceae bacterium]MBU9918482.1 bifunctional precorrin-2 dehydrogenase/sirohydrochlorin ferrochelatase [Fusobacteriaceae bacterium]
MKYYPVFLDMKDRKVLVVGGGFVALQKIKTLLDSGAIVKVITKELIAEDIKELPVSLEIREYNENDMIGVSIVIAATNSHEVNTKIFEHSKKYNVLLNAVDDKDNCDFILGAIVNKGDITVTISTAGKSPIVAKKIRDKVNEMLNINYENLLEVYGNFRARAYQELNEEARKEFFHFLEEKFDEILFDNLIVKRKFEELL